MAKVKIVKKLYEKGYPTSSKYYRSAHEEADKAEKKKFSKGYKKIEKTHFKRGELAATHDKKGNIKVEKRFEKFKNELVFHERRELKNDNRMRKEGLKKCPLCSKHH